MNHTSRATFLCDHCSKEYPWKPSIAGKRARCACGQVITVPDSPLPSPDEPDLYALAEPAPEAALPSPPLTPAPVAAVAAPAPRPDRFSFDALTHAPRDLYLPAGLLAAGVLGFLAWSLAFLDFSFFGVVVVSVLTAASTVVKTAVLIGCAFLAANSLGVSFGTVRSTIIKFAAIIIFTDACMLWFEQIMQATGAMTRSGRLPLRAAGINVLLLACLMSFLVHYLFDMDRDDTGKIAVPMAILSRVIGFIFNLVIIALITAVLGAADDKPAAAVPAPTNVPPPTFAVNSPAPANDPAAAPATPNPAAAAPEAPATLSPADKLISARIDRGGVFVTEARTYLAGQGKKFPSHRALATAAYDAGANKVCFDIQGNPRLAASRAYIDLPADPARRSACFAAILPLCQEHGFRLAPGSQRDTGQRFLVIALSTDPPAPTAK